MASRKLWHAIDKISEVKPRGWSTMPNNIRARIDERRHSEFLGQPAHEQIAADAIVATGRSPCTKSIALIHLGIFGTYVRCKMRRFPVIGVTDVAHPLV